MAAETDKAEDILGPVDDTPIVLFYGQLIPLHDAGRLVKELTEHLADKKVVVYCHHGQRSLQMTAFLRYQELTDVHSMAGGIDLWSIDIDPELPRY